MLTTQLSQRLADPSLRLKSIRSPTLPAGVSTPGGPSTDSFGAAPSPIGQEPGIGTLDEIRGAVPGLEHRETDLDLALAIGVGGKRGFDGIEALVGLLDRRTGHDAEKLVPAEANDQVIRAQLTADRAHCGLQQLVTGRMAACVVDRLQTDDVDVGNGELARGSAGTIDLEVELRQPWAPGARAGQHVGLGDRELV